MSHKKHVAVIPDLTGEYDRTVIQGISRFVKEERDWVVYMHDDPRHRIHQLQRWHGHGVIANTDDVRILNAIKKLGVPVVGYGGVGRQDEKVHFLRGSNEAIARLAAEHLMERGFTSFAYCGWAPSRMNPWSLARSQFFDSILRDAGFDCDVYRAGRGA